MTTFYTSNIVPIATVHFFYSTISESQFPHPVHTTSNTSCQADAGIGCCSMEPVCSKVICAENGEQCMVRAEVSFIVVMWYKHVLHKTLQLLRNQWEIVTHTLFDVDKRVRMSSIVYRNKSEVFVFKMTVFFKTERVPSRCAVENLFVECRFET